MGTCGNGIVSQVAKSIERDLDHTCPVFSGDGNGIIGTIGVCHYNFISPFHTFQGIFNLFGLIKRYDIN